MKLPKFISQYEKPPELDELQAGTTTVLDLISPASIERKSNDYIIVDCAYHAYLYVTGYGYGTRADNGWLKSLVEAGDGVNLNFILKRQPRDKILSKISSATMINRARMRDVGDTRSDYEELDSAISAGLYLKDGMNREMLDFYYMHTIIEVIAEDESTLEQRVARVQTLCTSIDTQCKRCDFKHAEAFLSSLPILGLDPDIERKSRRNVLTDSAAAAFPFSSFEICDQNGIMLGINQHNRSVAIVDIFDSKKYSNANMCVMGMTGAGKTFLLQLMALRLRMQDTRVFIIAPLKGHEFRPACEAVGGRYIKLSPSSRDCINIMEIRKTTLDTDYEIGGLEQRDDSILADKIQKLHIFFSLLKPDITHEERNFLDVALVECYARFGITHDNATIPQARGEKPDRVPILRDLYDVLADKQETKNLSLVINRFVAGSASRLGQHTNVDLDNKYIVLDISEMSKDLLPLGMFIALDFVWDEAFRVQQVLSLSDEETKQIIRNQRGQGLFCANRNRISVEFRSSQLEYDKITTSRNDLIRQKEENSQ